MAKAKATPKATPKATAVGFVHVYTLGIPTTKLYDAIGDEVCKPLVGQIYLAKEDNTELSTDGSTPIYKSPTDRLEPSLIEAAVKVFNTPPPVSLDEPEKPKRKTTKAAKKSKKAE